MSKFLLDDYPLIVLPKLAVAIGLNEAIILQQLHYWLQKSKNIEDGYTWVYNTIEEWQEQFPFWSTKTIRRIITSLKNKSLIVVGNYNKMPMDQTLWYRIDYDVLSNLSIPSHVSHVSTPLGQNDQMQLDKVTKAIPEITTETTTEIVPSELDRELEIYSRVLPFDADRSPVQNENEEDPFAAMGVSDQDIAVRGHYHIMQHNTELNWEKILQNSPFKIENEEEDPEPEGPVYVDNPFDDEPTNERPKWMYPKTAVQKAALWACKTKYWPDKNIKSRFLKIEREMTPWSVLTEESPYHEEWVYEKIKFVYEDNLDYQKNKRTKSVRWTFPKLVAMIENETRRQQWLSKKRNELDGR